MERIGKTVGRLAWLGVAALAATLTACAGSDDGNSQTTTPPPVAIAGNLELTPT